MRFPPSLLDEIRARIPVSQVVGRRVKLKRQGREFAGLSPFKHEKTPSFTVNDQKGFYHCFATQEHGDIFTFLMKTDGLSFPEAVEQLASQAGVEMPKLAPQDEAREAQTVTLRRITEDACQFFERMLAASEGRDARAYLERRGVPAEAIRQFRLGYAPQGRHRLKEHLAAKGYRAEDMAASGMLISGDDIPVSYDRFRHRLMFPIGDLRGEVIAFGGRALDADQQPKYLNSPETPLFHKGALLYNAASARKAAHIGEAVIVAEGYMDVIAFARAGFAGAVAPLGTALTPEQIAALWRMTDEPLLCFDGDSAGIKASHRAVETALPHLRPGKSLAFVFLPEGLDPDDLLREHGADAVGEALRRTLPLVDVLWKKELANGDWTTPERRAQLEARLTELTETIADKTVRQYYAQELRRRLREQFNPFTQPARRSPGPSGGGVGRFQDRPRGRTVSGGFTGSKRFPMPSKAAEGITASLAESSLVRTLEGSGSALPRLEILMLLTLINHAWLLDEYIEEVAALHFRSAVIEKLRDGILAAYSHENPLDNEALRHQLKKLGYSGLLTQIEHAITHNSDWNTQPDASKDDVLIGWRHRLALHRRSELKRELESAERAFAIDPSEENFLRLQDLSRQVLSADGTDIAADG
jgi:DNA primase